MVGLLGLISSIIAIIVFLTGIPSIPDFINQAWEGPTSFQATSFPTPTLEEPLQPLLTGTATIPINRFSSAFRLGFNFKLGEIASGNTPVDLLFSNCTIVSSVFNLYCELRGTDIWHLGNTSLNDIESLSNGGLDVLPNEQMETGKAYILHAYDGHPVKFRISNLEFSYENGVPTSSSVVLEYVYQPNDRQDFRGP
jgi:hypothetical protein